MCIHKVRKVWSTTFLAFKGEGLCIDSQLVNEIHTAESRKNLAAFTVQKGLQQSAKKHLVGVCSVQHTQKCLGKEVNSVV